MILHEPFTAADKNILKGDDGMTQGSLVLHSWLKISQLFRVREFRGRSQKLQDLEDDIRKDLDVLEGLLR